MGHLRTNIWPFFGRWRVSPLVQQNIWRGPFKRYIIVWVFYQSKAGNRKKPPKNNIWFFLHGIPAIQLTGHGWRNKRTRGRLTQANNKMDGVAKEFQQMDCLVWSLTFGRQLEAAEEQSGRCWAVCRRWGHCPTMHAVKKQMGGIQSHQSMTHFGRMNDSWVKKAFWLVQI